MEVLLKNGADPNIYMDMGSSPILSIIIGDRESKHLKTLLKFGAKTDIKDKYNRNILDIAIGWTVFGFQTREAVKRFIESSETYINMRANIETLLEHNAEISNDVFKDLDYALEVTDEGSPTHKYAQEIKDIVQKKIDTNKVQNEKNLKQTKSNDIVAKHVTFRRYIKQQRL